MQPSGSGAHIKSPSDIVVQDMALSFAADMDFPHFREGIDDILLLSQLHSQLLSHKFDIGLYGKDPIKYKQRHYRMMRRIQKVLNKHNSLVARITAEQAVDTEAFTQMIQFQKDFNYTDMLKNLELIRDLPLLTPTSALLVAQSARPKNYVMHVDTITSHLPNLEGQTQLRVGWQGSRPVLTTVTLDMPDHMRIEGGHALSSYDKSIINGITSLMESGNNVFSIAMLYHAMTGRKNPSIDEGLYEEILQKLEKMRRMMLIIDLSEEIQAQYIIAANGELQKIENLVLEGYLLPLNKMAGLINGKKTELFQIIQPPPLYTYAKMRRQLASVKISLLSAPVNNNDTTIPLKTYLLQRIELMKNENNSITQQSILYESIYQELDAATASKNRKMRIRNYATTILEYFVKQKYIASYIEYKTGRNVAGLQITLE